MAQVFVLFLILIHAFVNFSMASETVHKVGEPNIAPISSQSNGGNLQRTAAAPAIRKLGKHQHKLAKFPAEAPHLSPSELPQTKIDRSYFGKEANTLGHQDPESALMQEIHLEKHSHHASVDKSVAGGGVILGGLATTFFVAIFFYIRATRRNKARPQPSSPQLARLY